MRDLESEIKSLITRNQAAEAMKQALSQVPPPGKSEIAKKIAAEAILLAFVAIPTSSIDTFLEDASDDQKLTLIKYTYKCMSIADKKNCEILLIWHGKIVGKDGHGIITRALFDKRV